MDECTSKQNALAAIEGLTLYDCLNFFDESSDQRANDIVELCDTDDFATDTYHTFEIDTYHTSEGEDNGAYVLGWLWISFEGSKLSKVCSNCDSEDGEIKYVEMSDGTTESLCKTCLELICPGCEAAPDRPNRANLKRLAAPRSREPMLWLERALALRDDDGRLHDMLPPMDIEQENQLRAQAGLPLLDDVAVSARLNAAREEEEFEEYFRLRRDEFRHLWSDRTRGYLEIQRIYNVVRKALREEMRRTHGSPSLSDFALANHVGKTRNADALEMNPRASTFCAGVQPTAPESGRRRSAAD
jgi:hypothetical protein